MSKICFVHRENPEFLKYAALQAISLGFEVVIIGDDSTNIGIGTFHHISEFSKTAESFRADYVHVGVNPFEYELFCFQRWFIIAEYMKVNDGPLWVADHDILVYRNINYIDAWMGIISENRNIMFDSAWINFISNASTADYFRKWILSVYSDQKKLDNIAQKNAISGNPHVSDMHLLIEMAQERPDMFLRVSSLGSKIGIDPNIRILDNYRHMNGHKTIEWLGESPGAILLNGERQEFSSLHFQGPSKFLMQFMHTVPESQQTIELPDFTNRVLSLPGDTLGEQIKAEFERIKT